MFIDMLIGISMSLVIAGLAYMKKSLSISGFITAVIFGAILYAFGGWTVWIALIIFFISSSLLTKLHEKKEKEKDHQGRNYIQVISNALPAAIFSIAFYYTDNLVFLLGAVVAIAASNSDTWASEIGVLSKGKTRYIVNFKLAPKGMSGGVTYLGTVASLIGALVIGITFVISYGLIVEFDGLFLVEALLILTIGGFFGSIIDSYLGALIQAKYKGVKSGILTDKKSLPNEGVVLASGLAIVTNDMVNLLSTLSSSVIVILILIF